MAKVVIDAGHGGIDSGAVGNGIIEKDLNLMISEYIYNRLKELGIDAKLTRNSDETLTPAERTKRVLDAFGNNSDVLIISNHINSGGGDGAEVIYALRNKDTLSNLILTELENEGQNVRKSYQRKLPSDPSKDYYFMHRNTGNTEAVIVEYGFLDSKGDDVNQLKNDWQNYAEAVVRAITEYLNLNYIPITKNEYYTVKSGDSLWSIAKKYNISVNDLKDANGLTDSKISIGKVLLIPIKEEIQQLDNIYIVKKGDSLYRIAREYDTTVNELIRINNLTNTNLSIGQQIIIPKNENLYSTYTIKSGDTLYKIANSFNTTVNQLKKTNNLKSDILSVGQTIKIPYSNLLSNTYTVKSGDTLYKIANLFNTTVDELKKLNNITSDILTIGQIIKVI